MAFILMNMVRQRTVPSTVLCEPTQQVTGNTMECTFLVDIYKGILKGSSLSGRDPVQTLQLRNKSGSFYSNNWGAHHMPIGL